MLEAVVNLILAISCLFPISGLPVMMLTDEPYLLEITFLHIFLVG